MKENNAMLDIEPGTCASLLVTIVMIVFGSLVILKRLGAADQTGVCSHAEKACVEFARARVATW